MFFNGIDVMTDRLSRIQQLARWTMLDPSFERTSCCNDAQSPLEHFPSLYWLNYEQTYADRISAWKNTCKVTKKKANL